MTTKTTKIAKETAERIYPPYRSPANTLQREQAERFIQSALDQQAKAYKAALKVARDALEGTVSALETMKLLFWESNNKRSLHKTTTRWVHDGSTVDTQTNAHLGKATSALTRITELLK